VYRERGVEKAFVQVTKSAGGGFAFWKNSAYIYGNKPVRQDES
jgi:hypothetical protein